MSAIDPTVPVYGNPTTQSVRDNFATAASEIDALNTTLADVQTTADGAVQRAGDTMAGMLTLFADPSTSLHAATKGYVDLTPQVVSGNARGAVGDNATDNTSILTSALAVGPVGLSKGTYLTTFGQNAVPGPYFGPGQIKTSDGNKRGPIINQIGSAPASAGNWGSVTTAFNGDLNHVPFAIEHRITGSLTLTQPASGYKFTPETAAFAEYFYNSSGWNQATADNSGRTGATMHYLQGYQAGQGDLIAHTVSLFVNGARAGATSFLANPAASMLAGSTTAGQAGVYLQGIGDINLNDGGLDVAGIGLVLNLNRTNSTGALGATWMGIRLQSKGSQPIDAFYSVTGPATIGLDVVPMTTGTAAITMGVAQRIYGNATNPNTTKYSRYTVPGAEWIGYETATGWNVAVGGNPILQLAAGGITAQQLITLPGPPTADLHAATKAYADSTASSVAANYVPLAGGTMSGGLSMGGQVAASADTLTRHIQLHTAGYGFSITSSRINYVVPAGNNGHFLRVGGADIFWVNGVGAALSGGSIQTNGKVGTLFAGLNIAQPQQGFISWNAYQDTGNLWRSIAGGGVAYMTSNAGIITFNAAASSTAGNTVIPTQILQMNSLGVTMAVGTNLSLALDPTNNLHAATKQYVDGLIAGPVRNIGRNVLHNALFNVQQRGAGPWTATGNLTADRWMIQQVTDAVSYGIAAISDAARTAIGDEAAQFALNNTFTGNAAATAYNHLTQHIENVRRLAGKTITVSFWALAAAGTPKVGINILQDFGTGGSPSAPVRALATGNAVTLSTTWTRYSTTINIPSASGKTFGANVGTDYTALELWYSAGANTNAISGNIGVQSASISFWGVQLEIGSVATPLEKPDPRFDIANCQRFYQTGTFYTAGYQGVAANGIGSAQPFPVLMRGTPNMASSGVSQTNCTGALATPTASGFVPYATSTAPGSLLYSGTFTATADL